MRIHGLFAAAMALSLAAATQAQDRGNGHEATPATFGSTHGPGWSYTGPNGPEYWGRLDAAWAGCAAGQQESPIDLSDAISADLGTLDLQWHNLTARVFDTGHAIQVEASPGSSLTMGGKGYQLLQFHVHQPGEHLLNGHRYPLEIHFVHAAPDGTLGVVGVFAETGESNAVLQTVLAAAATAGDADDRPTLDLTALLPEQRGFFRYKGSLTTPPCSETVDWVVMAEPIRVSEAQIEAFARLHPGNTRPLQPLNRRFLLRSRD